MTTETTETTFNPMTVEAIEKALAAEAMPDFTLTDYAMLHAVAFMAFRHAFRPAAAEQYAHRLAQLASRGFGYAQIEDMLGFVKGGLAALAGDAGAEEMADLRAAFQNLGDGPAAR